MDNANLLANGVACWTDIEDRESNPCRNNGSCIDGIALWLCLSNLTGSRYEVKIDECEVHLILPYFRSRCSNFAISIDSHRLVE